MDAAFLIARLILGLGLAAHGAQKLFGLFGGYGIKGTGGYFETLGFRPGALAALGAGLGEFGGGMLTALGLFGAVGPALMILVMIVAILTVHIGHGFFATNNGAELPSLYIAGALLLAFAGFGAYSLDALFGLPAFSARLTWVLVALAIAIGFVSAFARRPPRAAAA